ncbi:MAG: D-alanyl-lipoteichoic acid biosynthesis protein DltB [Actinobacteria bacterium]|nr:D-alanyl-lipoteichoic acid biosynthesis protein DltB [Actinomycetota bacterium]
MSFYSDFAFFLLLVVSIIPAAVLGLRGKRIARYGLIVSCIFLLLLFYRTPIEFGYFVLFLLLEVSLIFFFLKQRTVRKNTYVFWAFLFIALVPLISYKVFAVFDQNFFGFLGISYITFKVVQIVIEIQDGLIKEMTLFDCIYFLVFFPPFTSGPIDRSRRFIADTKKDLSKDEYVGLLSKGLPYLLLGAVYKIVLSGIFYTYFTPLMDVMHGFSGLTFPGILGALWSSYISAFAYGFYLFFDFAGYSLMAIGASYCFGIETPRNFNAPFISTDIKEFWNRWHMTLSYWLRDFVFTRVVMIATKKKWFKSRLTTACCGYIINMTVMGFWHGITFDFILYGIYHGILLSATDIYQKKSKFYKKHKNEKVYLICSWFITLNLVMLGFALFSGQLRLFV